MGQLHFHAMRINIEPKPDPTTKVNVVFSSEQLAQSGFNLIVSISTASSYLKSNNQEQPRFITTMAHFDTGASATSIDLELAKHLDLVPTGQITQHTANGPARFPTFAIDLSFPNSALSPFVNLQIGSCKLPFNLDACQTATLNPANFGLLIGRDVMSKWNIVWNGPTSSVFISD